jgi:hypothetical protein
VNAVCEAIAGGALVKDACIEHGTSASQLRAWVASDGELSALYARARTDQAHAIAEQAVAIADGADEESQRRMAAMVEDIQGAEAEDKQRLLNSLVYAAVQRDKVRVDARKWMASKIAPKLFGDRLELAGDANAPLSVKVVFSNE